MGATRLRGMAEGPEQPDNLAPTPTLPPHGGGRFQPAVNDHSEYLFLRNQNGSEPN